MIRLPEYISSNDVELAVDKAFAKKNIERIKKVEYLELNEGKCIQMMQTGSFSIEPESLKINLEFSDKTILKEMDFITKFIFLILEKQLLKN